MKAKYKIDANTIIEVEADNLPQLLTALYEISDPLGHEKCGKCESTSTGWNVRSPGDYIFYELKCRDCFAVLPLGQHKNKTLFKKRMQTDSKGQSVKDENDKGIKLPDGGWVKWNFTTKQME
jgi:hypothetical protein